MGIGNFFRNQLSQVIEWKDQKQECLIYKFPSDNDEIKNAGKLILGPGQGAMVVYEGKVREHLSEEGIYDLETENHPFITTLLNMRTSFESEHKLKIYFYRTAENVNQGWGTSQSVKYVDAVYKIPVELGANGSFSFKISNPLLFFTEVSGSVDLYTVPEARQLLQSRFAQGLTAVLAKSGKSYQEIDTELPALSNAIQEILTPELGKLGMELMDFKLNGTTFDSATKERISKIANITAETMAAKEAGMSYIEMEKLKALRDAARNEGGLAGAGLHFGVGMELGKVFNTAKSELIDSENADPIAKLKQLKLLLDQNIITQEEFDAKKKEWLGKL